LIDNTIPNPDHMHIEEIVVSTNREAAYQAARHADFSKSVATRLLYLARGLPSFPTTIDGMIDFGFTLIDEEPPQEFVMGLAGQFWKPSGQPIELRPDDFRNFELDGFSIVVWNFYLSPISEEETRITTESRVRSNGRSAKAAMSVYWALIYPFSKFIRREILKSIARDIDTS